jgi:plastocyanin
VRTRLVLLLVLTLVLAGCGGGGGSAEDQAPVSGVTEVKLQNLQFKPPVIKVPVGTKVTWAFDDGSVPHNVVGPGFKSKTTDSGTFEHTFTSAGTFDYRCELHTTMKGKVVVG